MQDLDVQILDLEAHEILGLDIQILDVKIQIMEQIHIGAVVFYSGCLKVVRDQ